MFLFLSCSYEVPETSEVRSVLENKLPQNTAPPQSLINKTDYSDSINYRDTNGWKQGQWIRKWKGHLIEKYTYVNDTLNGHYETEHGEGHYKEGVKHGLQFSYYGNKESILMVNYYENGKHIWGAFPAAGKKDLIPLKDFVISVDSTYVKAPYINGQIWYEGSFCLLPDSSNNNRILPHRYGVHKIYHMNGTLKGIVDYQAETIQEFDSLGIKMWEANFDDFNIHKQFTIWNYSKR